MPKMRSVESRIRRAQIDAEIQEAYLRIHEPIDVAKAIDAVEDRIRRATDDAERDALNVERAALLRYQDMKAGPRPDEVSEIPELSFQKERKNPLFNDSSPVRRLGRMPVRPSRPVVSAGETIVLSRVLAPNSDDESELGRSAM